MDKEQIMLKAIDFAQHAATNENYAQNKNAFYYGALWMFRTLRPYANKEYTGLTIEQGEALQRRLDEHVKYVNESYIVLVSKINEKITDEAEREKMLALAKKEKNIALNLVDFTREYLEDFVRYCQANKK